MIKLTDLILENNLREYSDEEKRKMGIPSGATSRGGVWYVGDKYAGQVVKGKFVPAEKEQPAKPKATPTSPAGNAKSTYSKGYGAATDFQRVRKGITSKERQLVGKVSDMWYKAADTPGFMAKNVGKSYPSAEFEKMTGIPVAAAKVFSSLVDPYEAPFTYSAEDDTITVVDHGYDYR